MWSCNNQCCCCCSVLSTTHFKLNSVPGSNVGVSIEVLQVLAQRLTPENKFCDATTQKPPDGMTFLCPRWLSSGAATGALCWNTWLHLWRWRFECMRRITAGAAGCQDVIVWGLFNMMAEGFKLRNANISPEVSGNYIYPVTFTWVTFFGGGGCTFCSFTTLYLLIYLSRIIMPSI